MNEIIRKIGKKTVLTRKEVMLIARGRPEAIQALVEAGHLVVFGRSYLATPDLGAWQSLVLIVGKFFPGAVISGESSLRLNHLIDYEPSQVDADIPRETNQRNSLITFRRVSPKRMIGIHEVDLHGVKVRTYNPERSLAELWLNGEKSHILPTVLRNYVGSKKVDRERIAKYSRHLRVPLSAAVENALLSEQYTSSAQLSSSPAAPRIPVEKVVLQAAIMLYAQNGQAGLDPVSVAKEAGVDPTTVTRFFPTRRKLVKGVLDSFLHKTVSNGGDTVFKEDLSVREYLLATANSLMELADQDEVGYRIQKWAIAEACPEALPQIETVCSAFIELAKKKILQAVPTIGAQEAEARAIMFLSIVDQYTHMRWFYADLLKTEFSKHVWLEGYREIIRNEIINLILGPPARPSSQPRAVEGG